MIFTNKPKSIGQAETIALESGFDLLLESGDSIVTEAENQIQYSNATKHVSSWISLTELGFLLMQDGSYLLQQNGDRILLQESTGSSPAGWTNKVKN